MTTFLFAAVSILLVITGGSVNAGQSGLGNLQLQEEYKDVATGTSPAFVAVETQYQLDSAKQPLIELTLEPIKVSPEEAYLVNVYVVDGDKKCGNVNDVQFTGSVSFFPPPVKGTTQKFLVSAPDHTELNKQTMLLKIEIIPASSEVTLQRSAIKVLDAKIVY